MKSLADRAVVEAERKGKEILDKYLALPCYLKRLVNSSRVRIQLIRLGNFKKDSETNKKKIGRLLWDLRLRHDFVEFYFREMKDYVCPCAIREDDVD